MTKYINGQKYVVEYIELYESGQIKLNKERILLIEFVKKNILNNPKVYFEDEMIENCIAFGEKWYFEMQPFQKFLIAFIFLFWHGNNRVVFRKFLWMLGRGGGKNGLITVVGNFLISELHGIENYDISVVANSEDQAETSIKEAYNCVKKHEMLRKAFKATLTKVVSRKTNSIFTYRTSNGNTKDGLRDGAVVFDEIHQYMDNTDVKVHISGLGKRPNPREFYIGTDGYVRDGFLDNMKEKAMKVIKGESRWNSLFPFICRLDEESEIDDMDMWEKANPMLSLPRSDYAEGLYQTIYEEYEELEEDPSNYEEFITKRMNLPKIDLEKSVATWEEIVATSRPLPNLLNQECIGCLDFASIRDFAAVGLLFRDEENYMFKTHSYARKEFVDKHYAYSKPVNPNSTTHKKLAPIREWEQAGHISIVEGPTIQPQLIVEWFVEMSKHYIIKKIIGDNFRMEILKPLLEAEGFEVEVIRNPRAIHSLLAPRIETAFANKQIIFDDNPLMRWYTNNTLVIIDKRGNKEYAKKEPVKRKTDGFHCFVHGMYRADEITVGSSFSLASLNF